MDKLNLDIKDIQFIETESDEANASVSLNPTFRWMKFVLTDDQPNLNKHRIPQEEFDNLIRTGINAPIKMAAKEIKEGHDEAIPLGVITALTKENNYIKGLAALWSYERPEDVDLIKKRYDDGNPLNLSWEVLYSAYEEEDDGVVALRDTALRATTFVGMPAYAGRTPVLEVASVQNQEDNNVSEDSNLEELELLKQKVAELEQSVADKDAELAQLKEENQSLASFKQEVEAEKVKQEKLAAIKNKFVEAGLEKEDAYFIENSDRLLSLEDTAIDFMIQEFVSFASKVEKKEEKSSVTLPPVNTSTGRLDPKELGKKLRTSK